MGTLFDVRPKASEIALDAPHDHLRHLAGVLRCGFRLVLHYQGDLCPVVADAMERDRAGRVCSGDAVPGDTLVWYLLDDFRVPFLLLTPYFGAPVEVFIANLPDLFDPLHEIRKFFKMCPLLVRDIDGHIDLDLPVTVEGKLGSNTVRGKLNGGGSLLAIKTGDGSIRLEKL